MLVYVVVAVTFTRDSNRRDVYTSMDVEIVDSAHTGFVTAADVDSALGGLVTLVRKGMPRGKVNTLDIENRLRALSKIEDATCVVLNSGALRLTVKPMQPVARVFDGAASYYINAGGKRIPAYAGHHVDVPVISGHFSKPEELTRLLPMFTFIRNNPDYDALVTSVAVDNKGDIIMMPSVVGHVVNLGDTSLMANKFQRLETFYRDVLPVKGWDYYDYISVKWRGRVVATRRDKSRPERDWFSVPDSDFIDLPDDGTMMTSEEAAQKALEGDTLRLRKATGN